MSKGLDISGIENSLIVDIGGTTTDVGQLVKGFPREAAARVEVNLNYDFSSLHWCILRYLLCLFSMNHTPTKALNLNKPS